MTPDLLAASPPPDSPWADPAPLIAHILERYHAVHRADFPRAIELARRVEAVHGHHPRRPRGLADQLARMAQELELHQQREECVLFPLMLRGPAGMAAAPIARMAAEHDEMNEELLELAACADDFTAPEDACASWRALVALCRKIDLELREHMRLESEVLFPAFAGGAGR